MSTDVLYAEMMWMYIIIKLRVGAHSTQIGMIHTQTYTDDSPFFLSLFLPSIFPTISVFPLLPHPPAIS